MAHIPLNLDDVVESRPVKNGRYDLEIVSCEETTTKESGKPQLKMSIAIIGQDAAPNLSHYVGLPDGQDADKDKFKKLLIKRLCALFNVKVGAQGLESDDFIGAKATTEVTLSEPDANGNIYNRLNVPRLKDEGTVAGSPGARVSPPPPKR